MQPVSANILVCRDEDAAGREAAQQFACASLAAVSRRGRFNVALPGGYSHRLMLTVLTESPSSEEMPWQQTAVFFTDERHVPASDPESNYRLAHELLFSKVPIGPEHVFRFRTELSPEDAARDYESVLVRELGEMPVLDLVVLGMGTDTHTASLFPASEAVCESTRLAVVTEAPKRPITRLTLTPPVLNNARRILILASGEQKAQALRDVLAGEIDMNAHPIQAIRPTRGALLWIVDSAAASLL